MRLCWLQDIYSKVDAKGVYSDAEAGAQCAVAPWSDGCMTETFTHTYTNPFGGESYSDSVSGTDRRRCESSCHVMSACIDVLTVTHQESES